MAENHELEALDALVNSDGWKRFVSMVDAQWGPSSEWFLEQLDKALAVDGSGGTDHFRQVRSAQREIQKVMQMPSHRLAQIKAGSTKPSGEYVGSRRGLL